MIDALTMLHLVDDVKGSEGFRARPYLCPTGHCSIGYGTNLEAHPEFIPQALGAITELVRFGHLKGRYLVDRLIAAGMTWNKEQSEAALVTVLDACERSLNRALPWVKDIEPARQAVLLDMSYNMGVSTLLGFKKTLAFVQARDWENAADEMLRSRWARQVKGRALKMSNWMRLGRMV